MSNTPRVTIITATYNYSAVLRCAIESALSQTFQDFEHWIVGDGCTDDSEQVVAQFGDPRLHWYNLPTNSGSQSVPNNKGLELARGEYIAYLGHDDIWHPSHLARLFEALDETAADWAHPLAVMIGPPGSGVNKVMGFVPPGGDISKASVITSGVIHRRALIDKIGRWVDYRTLETPPDLEFHLRAQRASVKLAHIDNLSVFKFPSAWRKNVYREKPSHEQARYLERIKTEPDFIARELLAALHALEFKTVEAWFAAGNGPKPIKPSDPHGALVETWRQFRGLPPNALTPRPWWDILRIRAWRAMADVSRPMRKRLRGTSGNKAR